MVSSSLWPWPQMTWISCRKDMSNCLATRAGFIRPATSILMLEDFLIIFADTGDDFEDYVASWMGSNDISSTWKGLIQSDSCLGKAPSSQIQFLQQKALY